MRGGGEKTEEKSRGSSSSSYLKYMRGPKTADLALKCSPTGKNKSENVIFFILFKWQLRGGAKRIHGSFALMVRAFLNTFIWRAHASEIPILHYFRKQNNFEVSIVHICNMILTSA